MAELAKVGVSAAPACPSCRNRFSGLDLDKLQAGDEYQCLFCSEVIRIPQQVIDRLLAQREAERAEQARLNPGLWQRVSNFFSRLFGG